MKNLFLGLMAATAMSFSAVTSASAEGEPAVLFDLGGKFDKSFNEAAFNGAEQWKKETGKTYHGI